MSSKSDYEKAEWQLLLDVPPAVGTAVMYAGQSGVGSVKEAMAMAAGLLAARNGYEDVELIESLVDARLKNGEKSSIETLNSPYVGLEPLEILRDAVDKCKQAVRVLDQKASDDEIDAYCEWTMSIAVKVAKAAKEGGFLGMGGERVSQEEKRAIAKIRSALEC